MSADVAHNANDCGTNTMIRHRATRDESIFLNRIRLEFQWKNGIA